MSIRHLLAAAVLAASAAVAPTAFAQDSKHLAPGFTQLPKASEVVVMPVDVELFSMSAGGVNEPRADWTAAAQGFMKEALAKKTGTLGLKTMQLEERDADEFGELMSLHAAVARSIALHHSMGGVWALPTKAGKLEWSFDEAMKPLRDRTQARYGLFVWVRDSYASAERKVAMFAMALLGVGLTGGAQVGYASRVDLDTGKLLWFNELARASGDLRESVPAAESIDELMRGFPRVQ